MKKANTAINQEPPLQDCGWDINARIIWTNEHFPEKIADVVHNEYQDSDDVRASSSLKSRELSCDCVKKI